MSDRCLLSYEVLIACRQIPQHLLALALADNLAFAMLALLEQWLCCEWALMIIIPSLPPTTNTEMEGEKQRDVERLVSRSRMHSHSTLMAGRSGSTKEAHSGLSLTQSHPAHTHCEPPSLPILCEWERPCPASPSHFVPYVSAAVAND